MRSRSTRWVFATLAVFVLGVTACGAQSKGLSPLAIPDAPLPGTPGAPGPGAPLTVLHLQSSAGIETLALNGKRWTATSAVATPDWSTIFTVAAGQLQTLDGVTGAQRSSQAVATGLRPAVGAADGRFVALTDNPGHLGQGVMPAGRSSSTIVVAPANPGGADTHTAVLDGNILPEGFSTDDTRLFVLEFLPALHPDRYRVRALEIASGQLGPVYTFDKTIDTEEMQGLSRTQVFSPAGPYGSMLYTLYTRTDGIPGYGEVHALSVDGGFVHCTDLPASLHITPTGGAIAVSPDGRHVYVASAAGTVAEIDASNSSSVLLPIIHTTQLVADPGTTTVALAADDNTVWVGLGRHLVGLDPNDLRTVSTSTVDQPLDALAVQSGGALYAATPNAVESVQPSTGTVRILAAIAAPPARLAVL